MSLGDIRYCRENFAHAYGGPDLCVRMLVNTAIVPPSTFVLIFFIFFFEGVGRKKFVIQIEKVFAIWFFSSLNELVYPKFSPLYVESIN